MPESLPAPYDGARPRVRSAITTVLLIMISVMIVRDIFVRRWGAATPPASDVTRQSRNPPGVARVGEKPLNRANPAPRSSLDRGS